MTETKLSEEEIDALVDDHPHNDIYDNCLYCGNRDADSCPTVKLGNLCKAQARELLDLRDKVEDAELRFRRWKNAAIILRNFVNTLYRFRPAREAVLEGLRAENRQLRAKVEELEAEGGEWALNALQDARANNRQLREALKQLSLRVEDLWYHREPGQTKVAVYFDGDMLRDLRAALGEKP